MVAKIIEILVSGITGMANAIGGGLNSAVVALLWDGTNLTAFAQACLGFGATLGLPTKLLQRGMKGSDNN